MRKALTIGLAAAAISVALSLIAVGGPQREPVPAAEAVYALPYYRGPRIIHVPQPGERQDRVNDRINDRASTGDRDEPILFTEDDDEEAAPPPRRRVEKPKPRAKAAPARATPRWKPRSEAPPPPPSGPRRAVLSAPPPRAESLTPIYPTPRFDSKAAAAEKFAPPQEPAVTSTESPPSDAPPAQSD